MATATRVRMTAEEFLARDDWPEGIVELIDGEVVVTAPRLWHQVLVQRVCYALTRWTETAKGGGLVVQHVAARLGEHDVPIPDVSWWSHDVPLDLQANAQLEPPTLAVEVRSPSTWRYDVGHKRTLFERRGVRELWLVDTAAECVLVYRRSDPEAPTFDVALELGRGETLTSPLLAGFELTLDAFFEPPAQSTG